MIHCKLSIGNFYLSAASKLGSKSMPSKNTSYLEKIDKENIAGMMVDKMLSL